MKTLAVVLQQPELLSLQQLELTEPGEADVVVLDVQMQGGDGFWCLEEIRRQGLPVKVVMLSASGDGGALQGAWERQADGYALKTDPPRQTVAVQHQPQIAVGQPGRRRQTR